MGGENAALLALVISLRDLGMAKFNIFLNYAVDLE